MSRLRNWDERRDSAQENEKPLTSKGRNDLISSPDEELEEGEIIQTASTDHQSRPLPTPNLDLVNAKGAVSTSDARTNVRMRGIGRRNKLCFFWYHYQSCKRDPANAPDTERPCPYIHCLEVAQTKIKLSPFRHRDPCGLELCPWKDTGWKPKGKSKGGERKGYEEASTKVDQKMRLRLIHTTIKERVYTQAGKRKAFERHRNAPLPNRSKRQWLWYDDKAVNPDRDSHEMRFVSSGTTATVNGLTIRG